MLLPTPHWKSCAGSSPHLRGYSCGLWSLMHTLTILTLPSFSSHPSRPTYLQTSSREALNILVSFVRNFFSCEECRNHFSKMANTLTATPVISSNGDAVLWMWEAHNIVSRRVKDASSSDPYYPKVLFPSRSLCPYCYIRVGKRREGEEEEEEGEDSQAHPLSWDDVGFAIGESLLPVLSLSPKLEPTLSHTPGPRYIWNRTAVLLFLCNFYHHHYTREHISSSDVLHGAWPRSYPLKMDDHLPNLRYRLPHSSSAISGADSGLFSIFYLICFLLMVSILFFLTRHKQLRKHLRVLHAK